MCDGTTVLDYYEIPLTPASAERRIWSTDVSKRQRTRITYATPVHGGRMVVKDGRILERTKKLGVYRPDNDRWAFRSYTNPVIT